MAMKLYQPLLHVGLGGTGCRVGAELERQLVDRLGNHHHVGDVRGRGLFRGVELVSERATKAPFDPALRINARIKQEAMSRGLMVYPMGGTIDGRRGDHVLLAPPFIVDRHAIGRVVERLGSSESPVPVVHSRRARRMATRSAWKVRACWRKSRMTGPGGVPSGDSNVSERERPQQGARGRGPGR
jgi:hypothetical protein